MSSFSLPPGLEVGPYVIQGHLGAGGMGEVYRAVDSRDGRDVALKVLSPLGLSFQERLARFDLEARTLGALQHPNLPRIFEWNPRHEPPYLAMELLEGETLRDRLNRGPLSVAEACTCMGRIAAGLSAAHAKGIIHRDLKPTNVFLTRDGQVKLLDFGIAKVLAPLEDEPTSADTPANAPRTRVGAMIGTVGYMAPEQVRGHGVDARSDLFVCGILLYEMVFGTLPFEGASSVEQLNAILKEDPPLLVRPPDAAPPAFLQVLRRCLAKRPEGRYQTAEAFMADLEAASGRPQAGVRIRRWVRRLGPWAAAAAAVAGLSFWAGRGTASPALPSAHRLTFRQGLLRSARFNPEGGEILYSAAWGGDPVRVFSTRLEGPESRQLELPQAELLGLSRTGELALSLKARFIQSWMWKGTLARVPLAGGGPRPMAEDVVAADWAPDGESLVVVRHVDGKSRLERFPGGLLYESQGWISHPRCAPSGPAIAFLEHPVGGDDAGAVMLLEPGNRPVQVGPAWASIQGLAWKEEEIWFTAAASGVARALYAAKGPRLRTVFQAMGPLTLHDISKDGRRVLLSRDLMHTGIRARTPGSAAERDLSWLDWSLLQDYSRDGKWILFNEQGEGAGPAHGIYLRSTQGDPAIRLGTGSSPVLSPDGTRVAALTRDTPARVQVLPTNTGQPQLLPTPSLEAIQRIRWMPDGLALLLQARRPGEKTRLFRLPLDGSPAEPVSPEGVRVYGYPLSPDGRRVVARLGEGKERLLTLGTSEPGLEISGHDPDAMVVRWGEDGKSLFTANLRELPCEIHHLDLRSGQRNRVFSIAPEEPAGFSVSNLLLTPKGDGYAFAYRRILSELYLYEGLR